MHDRMTDLELELKRSFQEAGFRVVCRVAGQHKDHDAIFMKHRDGRALKIGRDGKGGTQLTRLA